MHIRTLLALLAVSAIAAPSALADDPCPKPAPGQPLAGVPAPAPHGGQIVTVGTDRYEIVQDSSSSSLTVYAMAEPGRTPVASQPARLLLLVGPDDSRREIALVAVPDRSNVWRATDDSLRSDSFDARLRVSVDGRSTEGSFRVQPASVVTAEPARLERPLAAHGGRILSLCASHFEFVHDAKVGRLTLFAVRDPAKTLAFDGAPTLVLHAKDGDRDLALRAVSGETDAWDVTDDRLKSPTLDGTLRLTIDGNPCEANLAGLSPMRAPHGGLLLSFAGDARLEAVHDADAGTLTFHAIELPGAKATFTDAPRLALRTPSGPRDLTLAPVTGQERVWSVTDAELRNASIDGTVTILVDGKSLESPLSIVAKGDIVPPSHEGEPMPPAPAPEGQPAPGETKEPSAWGSGMTGQTLVFGDNVARLQLHHDAETGRLGFLLTDSGKPVTFDADPVLFLSTDAGDLEIPLRRDPVKANAWIALDDRFKATSGVLKGKVRVKISGREHDAEFLHSLDGPANQPGGNR